MAESNETDALLTAVAGELKAQADQTDAAWEAVAARDDAALEAITAIEADVLRPLDEAEQDSMLGALFGDAAEAPEDPPAENPSPDNVVVMPRRRAPWLAAGAAGVVAAAAAVLLTVSAGPGPLPAYELSPVGGGEVQLRGPDVAPAGTPTFRAGSRVALMLRPDTAVQGNVELEAALVVDGARRPVELAVERLGKGALRVTAILGDQLPAAPGRYHLSLHLKRSSGASAQVELTYDYLVEPPDR